MGKRIFVTLFAVVLLFFGMKGEVAQAAPLLKVSVQAGLDGKVKYNKGAIITITVENTGTPFNGDLVVDIPDSYGIGSGRAFPLQIGSGEVKTVSFIIPSFNDSHYYQGPSQTTKSITFYEGGWEKGKMVEHEGAKSILPKIFWNDTSFIATFTSNPDRLSSLKGVVPARGNSVELIHMGGKEKTNIPDEALAWGAVDYVILDEFPLMDLSDAKQKALLEWVRSGGMLIVGGSDTSSAETGIFSEYLPLQLGEKVEVDASLFNEWAKTDGFSNAVTVRKSTLHDKSSITVMGSEHGPIVAYTPLGRGGIYQASFSFGDEPQSKMAGMSKFWSTLFLDASGRVRVNYGMHGDSIIDSLRQTIGNANELFASFKVSAPLMLGIVLIYMILIGPVLYTVLKRKDKREAAWWIIPTVAIVASAAIFGYGAKDRIGRVQIQQSSVLNVNDDGSLSGYYVESILSNKSGDFTFSSQKGTTMGASLPQSFFGNNIVSLHRHSMIEERAAETKLHFRKVGYWSVASIYGETLIGPTGKFTSDLVVENKVLKGTVSNDFPFPLQDVTILSGTSKISLGDFGPGEKKEINETIKTSTLIPRFAPTGFTSYRYSQRNDDVKAIRKESLLSFSNDYMYTAAPMIMGYTDTALVPIELEKTKANTSAINMVMQPISAEVILYGAVTVENEILTIQIESENNGNEPHPTGEAAGRYYFDEPVYIQTITLPKNLVEKPVRWSELKVYGIQRNVYRVDLLNHSTGEYEALDEKTSVTLQNANDYISERNEIKLRLDFGGNREPVPTTAPKLELKGEVDK